MILVVLSLLLSRGLETVKEDKDEPEGLVQRFGHCTQELLNLCLLGRAISHFHDGSKSMGGGYQLKGLSNTPLIGYLSRLEAMRYLEIGRYYKEPAAPLWVVGSESHFSVLFATSFAVTQPSVATEARRAFERFDTQQAGLVEPDKLKDILLALGEWPNQGTQYRGSCFPLSGRGVKAVNSCWERWNVWNAVSKWCS